MNPNRMNTSMEDPSNMSFNAGAGGGPSQNAKTLYKELALFEH